MSCPIYVVKAMKRIAVRRIPKVFGNEHISSTKARIIIVTIQTQHPAIKLLSNSKKSLFIDTFPETFQ